MEKIIIGYKKENPGDLKVFKYTNDNCDSVGLDIFTEINPDDYDDTIIVYYDGKYGDLGVGTIGEIDTDFDEPSEGALIEKIKYDEYSREFNFIVRILPESFEINKIEKEKLPNWSKRNNCSSKEEAISLLARKLSASFPININHNKKQLMEFAEKWDIPLNIDLVSQMGKFFDLVDRKQWDSSNCW